MTESRPPRQRRKLRPHLDPGAARLMIDDLLGTGSSAGRARAKFEAAVAAGAHEGAAAGDGPVLEQLTTAPVRRIGEIPYGSNAVFLLELEADDRQQPGQPLRAVYKPMRGERALWDFPQHTLFLREAAAYLADAALGAGHVPPTALRDGPFGPGSVQLFVPPAAQRPSGQVMESLEPQLRTVATLDVLINNADRKRAHLMLGFDGRIRAIDNALSFLPYPRQRTALIALGGEALPAKAAKRVRSLADDGERLDALRTGLSRLLSDIEVDAFERRLAELAEDPTYPVLDDWDGRPFEWF